MADARREEECASRTRRGEQRQRGEGAPHLRNARQSLPISFLECKELPRTLTNFWHLEKRFWGCLRKFDKGAGRTVRVDRAGGSPGGWQDGH